MTTFTNWTFSVAGNVGPTGPTGTVSLASPAFTGTPTAPTASTGTNTTQLATTEFVTTAAAGVTSGFRNKVINGDMRIAQRGTATITGSGSAQYPVDRWAVFNVTVGNNVTFVQSTDAPAGFTNSLLATVSNAAGSYESSGYTQITHKIEGFNCQDLAYGTASAKTIVLSFWVKSSVVGTQNVSFHNGGDNRAYIATYTIDVANTWEKKTVTIVGDTAGTWLVDSGVGLEVAFNLGMGTGYDSTAGSWLAGYRESTSGAIDFAATANATFKVTGVQLEQNLQPTPFEQRPYGTELALCQRYFHVIPAGNIKAVNQYATVGLSGGNLLVSHTFPVTMRTEPTVYTSGGSGSHSFDFYQSSAGSGISRVLVYQSGQSTTTIGFKTLAYSSDNNGGNVLPSNGHLIGILSTAVWVSAEL